MSRDERIGWAAYAVLCVAVAAVIAAMFTLPLWAVRA